MRKDIKNKTAEEIDAEAVAYALKNNTNEVIKSTYVEKMFQAARARNEKRKKQVTVFMKSDFKATVARIARSEGISISELIRRTLIIRYPETLGHFDDTRKWTVNKDYEG